MPAQMSHVNKLLAVHKQQQKMGGGASSSIPKPVGIHKRLCLNSLKRGALSFVKKSSYATQNRYRRNEKLKKEEKPGAPRLPPVAGRSQAGGAAQGPSCSGRRQLPAPGSLAAHTRRGAATWTPSSRGRRPGCGASIRCHPGGKARGLYASVCPSSRRWIFQAEQ